MSISFGGATDIDIGTGRPYMRNVPGGTLMAWLNISTLVGSQTVIGFFGNTGTTRAKFSVNNATGTIGSRANALDADATSAYNSTGAVTPSVLTHVACVYNFSSKSGLTYINGVLDTAGVFANMTAGNTSDTNCLQARIASNETGVTNSWNGLLEDIRVYNRSLGPGEILSIYTGLGADGIYDGLQARWPMSELGIGVTAANITDISINSFGGVVGGAATYQAGITNPRGRRSRQIISP